jgi:hypothetical protein
MVFQHLRDLRRAREAVEGNLQKEATPMGRELLQERDQKRDQGFSVEWDGHGRWRSIRGRLGVGSVFAGNSHHVNIRGEFFFFF